ncbi:Protein of unknown function [Spirosomataceae bacterium TFI 002]|nr:Protein of unknown function [Spirosomataceae bacterium TFI 002]
MEVSTPAILFSTISLLLLAFTNRYLAMANLIRGLHKKFKEEGTKDPRLVPQIKLLLKRLKLIRNMQIISILSLLFSAVSMLFLFLKEEEIGIMIFGAAIGLLILSLVISVIEITMSNEAIKIELSDMEEYLK